MARGDLFLLYMPSAQRFAEQVARHLNRDAYPMVVDPFNDGEKDVYLKKSIKGADVFLIDCFQPDPMLRFSESVFAGDTIYYTSPDRATWAPTYLGFMRKDHKDKPRVSINIRAVAEAMERYFNAMLSIEPHSKQLQGIFRMPTDMIPMPPFMAAAVKREYGEAAKDFVFVSPDAGGLQRVEKLTGFAGGSNLAGVYKIRASAGKAEAKGVMGNVKGRTVFLYDDVGDTGGSLVEAARMVKEGGATRVEAMLTHAVLSPVLQDGQRIPAEQRLQDSDLDRIYVTNTIYRDEHHFDPYPKFRVLDVTGRFARAIDLVHRRESTSPLFDNATDL